MLTIRQIEAEFGGSILAERIRCFLLGARIRLFVHPSTRRLLKGAHRLGIRIGAIAHASYALLRECIYIRALRNHDVNWQR